MFWRVLSRMRIHLAGKLMEAYATLPDGKRQWLIRIPDWDLNRQAVYRYRQPLFLPRRAR